MSSTKQIDKRALDGFMRYRRACLILAFGYWVYQFFATDLSYFAIHFRYLTTWALTLAVIAFALLTLQSHQKKPEAYLGFIAASAVVNILVVFLYWRLYFIDPALISGDRNSVPVWYQQYYLHLLGPALLSIEAIFMSRAFQKVVHGIALTIFICLLYSLWIETVVSPMNDRPVGALISGMPYQFLNDMEFGARLRFYGTTILTSLGFFALAGLITWLAARLLPARPPFHLSKNTQ